jgi:nucleoside-diphosphate-sugar epimerase
MNLVLDGQLFREAVKAHVEKIIFASSGCVYPNHLQSDLKGALFNGRPCRPALRGRQHVWLGKAHGELTLQHFVKAGQLKAASCRYFTVYGPRGKEDHAVIAMIARAFIQQNPFEVWGTGEQIRNWTYIDDIVEGTILAAEGIDDGTAVNLGTMERIRVVDAAAMILRHMGVRCRSNSCRICPRVHTTESRPIDWPKAISWEPRVPFREGIVKTIDWYVKTEIPTKCAANCSPCSPSVKALYR